MKIAIALLALPLLSSAVRLHADTLNYNLTGVATQYCLPVGPYCGTETLEFQISSTAVPESDTATSFTFGPDQYTFTTASDFDTPLGTPLTFYTDQTFNIGTGYDLNDHCGAYTDLPLFSGSTAHPTLLTGSSGPPYDFTDQTTTAGCTDYPYENGLRGNLIITESSAPGNLSTPEPSTLVLLGTGVLAAAQSVRRRRA